MFKLSFLSFLSSLCLQKNYTVRELYLRDNKLGANGFEYLLNGLVLNNTLRLLVSDPCSSSSPLVTAGLLTL